MDDWQKKFMIHEKLYFVKREIIDQLEEVNDEIASAWIAIHNKLISTPYLVFSRLFKWPIMKNVPDLWKTVFCETQVQ